MVSIEDALDRGGAVKVVDDWPERRRAHLLTADAVSIEVEVRSVTAPAMDGIAAVAGALYVVEGSRHGARHLRRLVPENMASSFLDADQVQGNWAKLLDRIDTILYDDAQGDVAVKAALATFGAFERSGRVWMKA
jgi:heme oxygenase (biliverdin-IX-beta and delta-forming)